jgi:hypothetical protein
MGRKGERKLTNESKRMRVTRLQQGERISEFGGTEATMRKMGEGMR